MKFVIYSTPVIMFIVIEYSLIEIPKTFNNVLYAILRNNYILHSRQNLKVYNSLFCLRFKQNLIIVDYSLVVLPDDILKKILEI